MVGPQGGKGICVWWVAVIRELEDEYLETDFCFQFEQ